MAGGNPGRAMPGQPRWGLPPAARGTGLSVLMRNTRLVQALSAHRVGAYAGLGRRCGRLMGGDRVAWKRHARSALPDRRARATPVLLGETPASRRGRAAARRAGGPPLRPRGDRELARGAGLNGIAAASQFDQVHAGAEHRQFTDTELG